MSWVGTIAYWAFGSCFVAGVGVILVSLNRLRKELNSALPVGEKVSLHPPLPHSFGQLILRTNLLAHSLELLEKHRKYYPSSSLPRILTVALLCTVLSFIGFVISAVVT
jgi:hypothetical protein